MRDRPIKRFGAVVLLFIACLFHKRSDAQVCSDPSNYIFGFSSSGSIYEINVNNASVAPRLNTPYGSPSSPNALGFNGKNGKFYYFNSNYPSPQFISYDPASSIYEELTIPAITNSVVTGCINHDGTGYYCLDLNANLFFYNIAANTWTKITSTFYNTGGTNITSTMKSLASGDMAVDGNGNLWFVISSTYRFGLYELTAPLPTVPVSSITMRQVISPTTPTPDNSAIPGIAFNATGQIYLSTLASRLYIVNNDLTTSRIASFSTVGVGVDLTSCNFPVTVLATTFLSFTGSRRNDELFLKWSVSQLPVKTRFYIEQSSNGTQWSTMGVVESEATNTNDIRYNKRNYYPEGNRYYRVYLELPDKKKVYSPIYKISYATEPGINQPWPNPTADIFYLRNTDAVDQILKIISSHGQLNRELKLKPGINGVDISALPSGVYSIHYRQGGKLISRQVLKK